MTWYGTVGGGDFEDQFVRVFDHDGRRAHHIEIFDVDQLDAALARHAELEKSHGARFANAASRLLEQGCAAWDARDWERFAALPSASFRCFERRRMVRLELDRDAFLQYLRPLFDMSGRMVVEEVLATRGERLALVRLRGVVEDASIGPSEIEVLCISEVDDRGAQVAMVALDADDLDAAYLELDDRYGDQERAAYGRALGASRLPALFAVRQWDRLGALLAAALVVEDHRTLGWGTIRGPADYLALLKSLAELSPDAVIRANHLRRNERGILIVTMLRGTREGGVFEDPRVLVGELDARDRISRLDFYGPEQLDEALARFELLGGEPSIETPAVPDALRIPPNAAIRTSDRWQEAYDRRDWDAVAAQFAASLEYDDRRRVTRLRGDRETLMASMRYVGSRGITRVTRVALATAGDRLVLERFRWAGGADETRFEVEAVAITEVDAQGRVVAHVLFDLEDRLAASREMLERFLRSDAARVMPPESGEMFRALLDHDPRRCRAVLPDDFVLDDHRRTGLGRLEGADAYIAALSALFVEAPNVIVEPLYYLAVEPHGALAVAHTYGTLAGGGEFENAFVQLGRHSAKGIISAELYELDDLDAARKRFADLCPRVQVIPPNAASRARDLMHEAAFAGSLDDYRALVSADFVYVDRTRQALVSGGVEQAFRSTVYYLSLENARVDRTDVAALGDRILVEHVGLRGGPPGGEIEGEGFCVTELGVDGRVIALVWFDVGDRRAALADANARFAAGEAAGFVGQAPISAVDQALQAHDYARLRRYLAEDLVLRDYRKIGLFDGVSGEAWIDSLRVHAELAPDLYGDLLAVLAINDHGRADVYRITGTAADGVAFENMLIRVTVTDGKLIRHLELFDPQDRARALARFEELRAASSAARAAG
jgi:hypothetical protein